MNKNCFKILILFGLIVLGMTDVKALTLEPYINESSTYKVVIEDDAELLNEDELDMLKGNMIPLTEYGHVAFKTISDNYTSAASFAEDYYHNKFSTESGTLFLIDMDNRIIYIFSDGENHKFITNSKADIITDNVYSYATDKEYYRCASIAFEQIYTILQGGKIAEPMRYISNFFIAITLGFFATFIYVLIGTNINKASIQKILAGCTVDFQVSEVKANFAGQTKVYSPQSDGGSSSGGGGGGGGSSGGGGGHSF